MSAGGKKKGWRRSRRVFYDDAYLESGLSKGEAERRAWKAISMIEFSKRSKI